MPTDFRLPDLGEGVHEGQIVRLLVAQGDHVKEDQPLLEVETDKASVEIPSPYTGVVAKVHVAEQQVVNVGDVMISFDSGATETAPAGKPLAASRPRATTPPRDVALSRPLSAKTKPASPAVRKLARQLGVDLAVIEGSGPASRVTREDVERAAASTPSPFPRERVGVRVEGLPSSDRWGPTRREPVTRARRTIAEMMVRSKSAIPHVTDTDDADITDLDQLRHKYRDPDKTERKLTILPFAVKATALALQKFPIFNAGLDEQANEIVYHEHIGIAIGVHTDRGLIAPVLRNVDQLTVGQIADELAALTDRARNGTFAVNDTRGGTFTISNAGAMGGSRYSTPIINYPQSAILALGRSRWQPSVVEQQVVPRLILPLSLSFDHRLIDGAQSIAFMQEIIGSLESPAQLL
ncbi:MAG: dihydrolipoamide acetyltransferase family protein [Planctomycetota bacterium]|nr:dihydrolipoamide acetyltransferase family protein [Planctomycetota bacterium]MCZ6492882.1 dihydrolipoamide acetyltransferase family protein [Planctomycetota bacterium]MCZ6811686.1 dihydrolipoamide acetyltransferase family protein [Planctomycetota bacterium]